MSGNVHRFSSACRYGGAIVAFFVLGLTSLTSVSGQDKLINLDKNLNQILQNFPIDVAANIMGTEIAQISQISHPNQPSLDAKTLQNIIDTDLASGVIIPKKGEYQFLINLKMIHRVNKIVITGDLKGTKIRVQLAEFPIPVESHKWKMVVEDKSLNSPSTSFSIRPQAALQILVTLDANRIEEKSPISLCDVAFYSQEDLREFKLEDNTRRSKQPINFAEQTELNPYDLGSMYAGARVFQISPTTNLESANSINDDNSYTFMEFDPNQKESIFVMDLGQTRRVCKISTIHSQTPGELSFYLTDQLPWNHPEQNPTKVAQLAWLSPVHASKFYSDIPIFAQIQANPSPKNQDVVINPAAFESIPVFGSVHTDSRMFSQINMPASKGRYIIARFVNQSTGAPSGFRVYNVNVFGDYPKDAFKLVRQLLPEPESSALIQPNPNATPPQSVVYPPELSRVGSLVSPTPAPSPPPASPSTP